MAILSPLLALGLIICLSLPARCSTDGGGEPASPVDWTVSGELCLADGRLALERGGMCVWERDGGAALPYRIVTSGSPALLTTAGPGLGLATHAAGPPPLTYPDRYPVLAGDGWAVLSAMPRLAEQPALALDLIDAAGEVVWHDDSALVLWPVTGNDAASPTPEALYFATTGDLDDGLNELIYPLGLNPRLASLDPLTGDRRWTVTIPTDFPVVHAELLALGDHAGLASLQYDYLIHELVAFDTATGAVTGRHRLEGLVAQRLSYPGPQSEFLDVELTGDTFTALVYLEGDGAMRWELDLAAGTLAQEPAEFADGQPVEDNPQPVGGTGTPGPGNHPFNQNLLPTAAGDSWRIPALTDAAGNTVIATTSGLVLIDPGGDEITAKR